MSMYYSGPLVSRTPAELDQLNKQLATPIPPTLADTGDDLYAMGADPVGRVILGMTSTLVGSGAWAGNSALTSMFSANAEYEDPLNYKLKSEYDPMKDPVSWGSDNNADGITEMLKQVPSQYWGDLLAAPSFGKFRERQLRIRAALPEGQAMGSGLGLALGIGGDLAGLTALGVAAEPLALMGLGARTTMAADVAKVTLGVDRMAYLSQEAAAAASTIGRSNLFLRYAALGAAEQTVYEAGKYSWDPTYDPTMGELVRSYAIAGGFSGVIGGALLGRSTIRHGIEDAVNELKVTRPFKLINGYQIDWTNPYMYNAPAAADQMLFALGTGSTHEEATRIAQSLWKDWNAAPGGALDLAIPGTRTVSLPQYQPPMAEVSAAMAGMGGEVRTATGQIIPKGKVGPIMAARSAIKAAAQELSLAGLQLNEQVFTKIAEALIKTDASKLRAGAFNKAFWEEVLKDVPAEVVAKMRDLNKRAFIGGIDKSVQDVALREDMVNSVYQAFRNKEHLQPGQPKSLIFQVLQKIADRGGRVDREEVGNIIDELRKVVQEPPTRINARGATRIDYNARRAMVAQIINSRLPASGRMIALPKAMSSQINALLSGGAAAAGAGGVAGQTAATAAGGAAGGAGGVGGGAVPGAAAAASQMGIIPKAVMYIPGVSKILNQALATLRSDNEGYRLVAWMGFNARRDFGMAQPQTLVENALNFVHARTARLMTSTRQHLTSYIFHDSPDVNIAHALRTAFADKAVRTEFNQKVIAQIRSGAFNDASASVNAHAKAIQGILQEFHSWAHQAGLPGFDSPIPNYFPRMWKFDAIRRLGTTTEGTKDLTKLIRTSLDQQGRQVVINGVTHSITGDLDAAAEVFTKRLIDIANHTENAALTAQDQQLVDAMSNLLAPLKGTSGGGRTPFGHSRVLLDEAAKITTTTDHLNLGRMGLSIGDITHDDINYVLRKYMSSVAGSVNEKRMIDAANAFLAARGILGPVNKKGVQTVAQVSTIPEMLDTFRKVFGAVDPAHEKSIKEVIAAMRFEPISDSMAGWGDRVAGYALPLGYLSTGGQFGLAALSETARIVGTVGLRSTIQQLPVVAEMVHNWANLDRGTKNFASFIDAWFAPSTDRLRRAFSSEIVGLGDQYERNIIKRGLDKTANAFSDISGLAGITSMTQQLTAAAALQHLYDVSKGVARRLDASTVRTLGLEPAQYESIIKYIGTNAETTAGFLGDRITGLRNLNAIEMDTVKAFVDRMVRTRIQDVPTRGDFAKEMFSWWARFFTQFRTFNLKGVDNFMLQNASRVANGGGARVASEITATAVLAATVGYLRNYADWFSARQAKDYKKADQLESLMGTDGWIKAGLNGPSEFWLPLMLADAGNYAVNKDPIFGPYRYSGLPSFGAPVSTGALRAYQAARDVAGATVGKQFDLGTKRDITSGTLHNFRLLMPFQNLLGLKQYLNVKEADIEREYNLNRTQIRYMD